MGQVDRNQILERYKDIYEFRKVVGIWEFAIEECPITLKIKVIELAPGRYYGVANYGIKTPQDITDYRSMRTQESVQRALEDALSGFFSSWNPEKKDQIEFVLHEDWW